MNNAKEAIGQISIDMYNARERLKLMNKLYNELTYYAASPQAIPFGKLAVEAENVSTELAKLVRSCQEAERSKALW